jgi:hypothetical protein
MQTEEFALPTTDGVTQLRGDVIIPDGSREPVAALLMIPGGGFTERDGAHQHIGHLLFERS